MEEEELQNNIDNVGKDLNIDKESGNLDERVGMSNTEHFDNSGRPSGHEDQEVGTANTADESLFEQVSLKDKEKAATNSQGDKSCSSDDARQLSGDISPDVLHGGDLSPGFDLDSIDIGQIVSSDSLDSDLHMYGDGGNSLAGSPNKPKPKPKPDMSDVTPELLHLVDSAIMGKSESMDTLKNIVSGLESFGNGESAEDIALLIVDSLLATMGGVESFEDEDSNPPSVMLNSRAAIVSGELIPWLPCVGDFDGVMSPRTQMVRGLLAILRACTRNRCMCSTAGLLRVLLQSAEKIFLGEASVAKQQQWDGTPLCYCIQYLAEHSLRVIDLHRWFEVITRTLNTDWAARLVLALEKAMNGKESTGPACTFEFDGESSALLGPGDSSWPFVNGYAFATWIYIESFANNLNTTTAATIAGAAVSKSNMSAASAATTLVGEGTANMPRLFSFISSDNQIIEAYFHAQFLVVESGIGKGKKTSVHFTHAFKPQCWYFLGVEHTCKQGLLNKAESELRLYIDGSLYESIPSDFPKISKPLAFCCIGTNQPPTMADLQRRRHQCPLFAEMGPIYIFKDSIGPEKMARIAARGGDSFPLFGNGSGLPWISTDNYVRSKAEESALLDADIGGCLHLLYHPSLLSGRFCSDSSPSGAAGMLRRPAEVLGQVHVATRMRPAEALWSLAYGGPMSLLPLAVSSINESSSEPQQGKLSSSLSTTALASPIFRIISMAIQHPGNNEELCRIRGPEILSKILKHLIKTLSSVDGTKYETVDEELVAAIVTLCQSQNYNHALKVQFFSTLLLDLKIWGLCSYVLQKKLLSSLADIVFTQASVMRDANAIQMLLDGCRRCYWTIREKDSVNTFSQKEAERPVGKVNELVDELLVVIELLLVDASPSFAVDDMRCLLGFMVDCPQPNQVARVLHLIHRLVVQPNTSRAQTFANAFISSGGIESLLVLLQREANAGDAGNSNSSAESKLNTFTPVSECKNGGHVQESDQANSLGIEDKAKKSLETKSHNSDGGPILFRTGSNIGKRVSASENSLLRNLDSIRCSITGENARNNAYNVDQTDGILVAIVGLLGALVISGYLNFGPQAAPNVTGDLLDLVEGSGTMFDDKVSLLHFALQKVLQAAPNRLFTSDVCIALLGASINVSSTDDAMNFYDSRHRFEHLEILLVLLRSLPFACKDLQDRALQDLLFLACSHYENRKSLTQMEEWPEWILEVLISNYEMGTSRGPNSYTLKDVEDLIHNFLIIMLEHSMRQKDGWKDIEATIHCAEWLCMVGGSSTGEQRVRREESLPMFKRRLLGELLDFSARELQVQTQIIAAAAAGIAAEGLSPLDSKAEAENAAQVSVALVENAIVILMLVEDHLRLQSKLYSTSRIQDHSASPLSRVLSAGNTLNSGSFSSEPSEGLPEQSTSSSDSGGLPLDVLTSMADSKGQISAAAMERLTAAAAAEPYQSVSCAFVSYGSCPEDLAQGWKFRSWLWYGIGIPSTPTAFGGGGSGWESWRSALEKDENGNWIELPLIEKSVFMLQALMLDDPDLGGGLGIGGGPGTGMGNIATLYQLLDSDQPFLCMLRMILLSMREEDDGESRMKNVNSGDDSSARPPQQADSASSLDNISRMSQRNPESALLWSVLSPILNMTISESKRQRVLVACCVLYSEVWHSVGKDRTPLRKQYLEAIMPPFVATLRKWRPLLAGIPDLATNDDLNPFAVDDRALATDASPIEAALSMISPGWAAAFASPPAALALAMIAAGAGGGETPAPATVAHLKRDSSLLERKAATKFHTFSSFQKPLEDPNKSPATPKDKAAAKAATLAAARDLERSSKIGTGRGLSAVAMATSAQRRNKSDMERVNRWNVSEAMATAWMECLQSVDSKSVYGKDFNAISYKFIAVLVGSLAFARNMQRSEVDRRAQMDVIVRHRICTGIRAWRKLIHYLIEMKCLFGPSGDNLCNPERNIWRVDCTESSSRRRRCLRRNYHGSEHCDATANEDNMKSSNDQSNDFSPSKTSSVVAEAMLLEAKNEDEDDEEEDNVDLNSKVVGVLRPEEGQVKILDTAEQPFITTDPQITSEQEFVEPPSVVAPDYVPSEHDERTLYELPASMVRPLKVLKGIFQVTTKRIIFVVDKAGTIHEESALDCSIESRSQEKDQSWLLSSLRQIYRRRYLLRKSALELFMVDRSNIFIDLGSTKGRRCAYRAIVQACPPHLNDIFLATQKPDQLLKKTQLMERWARWEISNFEYLMQLNTLAGRSYNDITQYPVFPWILSDYSSKTLDLSSPSSYRDLSKPVGALKTDRLKKFQERYSSVNDPVIPKFHYDSHYLSAESVLYYLSRVEPFTTLAIQSNSRKFFHEDNMFSDISATWSRVLEDMNDVKELVPELFYLPEILTNQSSVNSGTKLGEKFDSVRLPIWAENAVDFIHKHQQALESEHVSAHLHEWVDLIFGYKQRGKEAVSAYNVFFYLSYEGTIDIDKILDPVQKRAIQDEISYFGQTPSQLLSVPHLKKMPLADVLHLQTIFRNPTEVQAYRVPSPERCNLPAACMYASSDSLIIVDINAPAAHIAQHKWQANTPDDQGTPFVFQHGKATSNSSGGKLRRMLTKATNISSERWNFPQALTFPASGIRSSAVVAITCDMEIITGGHVDNSIRLVALDDAKTLEIARGHYAPVTCLALSPDSNYLVTGSRDATLLLWRVHRTSTPSSSSMPELSTSSEVQNPATGNSTANSLADKNRRCRFEGPIRVLRGHLCEIISCSVNSDLGIVASCSNSSDVLLHLMKSGRLIRRLVGVRANVVSLSPDGIVIAWNESLHILSTYTLNGTLIASAQLAFSSTITCIEVSFDGQSALIGLSACLDDRGCDDSDRLTISTPSVSIFDLYMLKVVITMKLEQGQDVTAMALTKDNTNLVVSTANRQLIVFTDPKLNLKVKDQMHKLGGNATGLAPS